MDRTPVWYLSIYIKLRFCLYIGPNHATFWLHTFQAKLWTKTPSTKFLSVCLRGFREKLLTIHLKTASGIIMKFHIWLNYLLTYVFSYITFWYIDPKLGFGGRTNGNYQITPKLLALRQIVYEQSCRGCDFWQVLFKKIPPKNHPKEGGNVNSCPWSKLNQILYT